MILWTCISASSCDMCLREEGDAAQEPVTVPPPGPVRLIQPQSLLNARPFANGQPFNAFGPQVVPPRPALVEPPRGRGKIRPSQKRPDAPPPPPPPAKPKWKEELSQQLRDIGNGVLLRYEKARQTEAFLLLCVEALLEYGSLGVLVDMLQTLVMLALETCWKQGKKRSLRAPSAAMCKAETT